MVHDVLQKEVIKFGGEPEEEQITPMDMTYESLPRRTVNDQAQIEYAFGMSRDLEDDEDIFVCVSEEVENTLRPIEYIPNVDQLLFYEEPHRTEPWTEDQAKSFPIWYTFSITKETYISNTLSNNARVFVYKKATGKVVATNFPFNIKNLKPIRSTPGFGLYTSNKVDMNRIVQNNERFVWVLTNIVHNDPAINTGDVLTDGFFEFVEDTEDTYVTKGAANYYLRFPEGTVLERLQRLWVCLVDDTNTVIDCSRTSINNVTPEDDW